MIFPTCLERGKDFKTGGSTEICYNDWSFNCWQNSYSKSALPFGGVQLFLAKAEVASTTVLPSVGWWSFTAVILLHPLKRLADGVLLEGVGGDHALGGLRISRFIDMVWRWILPLRYQLQRGFRHFQQLLLHSVIMAKGCYAFYIGTCTPEMTHFCEDEEVFHPTPAVSSPVTIVRSMNVFLMASLDATRHARSMWKIVTELVAVTPVSSYCLLRRLITT